MARDNFDKCLAETLKWEGGYVNLKADPGGETNMGISKRSYPSEDIKGMTRARAALIYKRDYWDAVQGDDLPAGLDLIAFDAAVNSGVSRGAKWLQRAVGAVEDGKVGPDTLARAKAANQVRAINSAITYRRAFLMGLKTWPTFGKGWTRRLTDVASAATDMATNPPKSQEVATSPNKPTGTTAWVLLFVAIAAAAFIILKG